MRHIKDLKPFSAKEVPGVKRVVELLGEELAGGTSRKRRSILASVRRFLLELLPEKIK